MRIRRILLIISTIIAILALASSSASAKTWHYKTTTANTFSRTTFHQGFIYGHYDYMELYKTAQNAKKQYSDTGKVIDQRHSFTARRTVNKKIYEIIYKKRHYFMNTNDTYLYRYNTWRSGHKLISTVKPTEQNKVVLKAHTHFYRSQYWLYNYGGQEVSVYNWYKLSKKGHWVIDYLK